MTKADKRYTRRFTISMTAYAVLLAIALVLAGTVGDSPWRFVIMALPFPALLGVVWAMSAYLRESDEFISRSNNEALAIGFGAGSLITFTYGLMQVVGAPDLNWMFVAFVYGFSWLIGSFVVRRRYS